MKWFKNGYHRAKIVLFLYCVLLGIAFFIHFDHFYVLAPEELAVIVSDFNTDELVDRLNVGYIFAYLYQTPSQHTYVTVLEKAPLVPFYHVEFSGSVRGNFHIETSDFIRDNRLLVENTTLCTVDHASHLNLSLFFPLSMLLSLIIDLWIERKRIYRKAV